MKKLELVFAALMSFAFLIPTTAEAGGCRTQVTYEPCGTRITWEYRYAGRDWRGCPAYHWVAVSRCAPQRPRYYDSGYHAGGYSGRGPRYTHPGGRCGIGHTGISFHFRR